MVLRRGGSSPRVAWVSDENLELNFRTYTRTKARHRDTRRINRVLIHQGYIALGLPLATALVAGFFAYIYSLKRQQYLLLWTAGWALFSLHHLGPALAHWVPSTEIQTAMNHWLFGVAGVLFFLGGQVYAQRQVWVIPGVIAITVLFLWSGANAAHVFQISAILPGAIIYIGTGVLFWQESRRQETLADRLLAVAFAGWGAMWMLLHYLRITPETQGSSIHHILAVPSAFVAMLMVMALYEEEKRRIERNMLALSNLNLATSSFVGGEIQRMLSQALDRVLGVVRLPVGALFLHHGDPQGPTSVVAAGLSDDFCRAAR